MVSNCTCFSFVYFEKLKYNRCVVQKGSGGAMNYLTVKEAGEKWGITGRMVTYYCEAGRIEGALKKGNLWLVPANAEKPVDGRTKDGKKCF